MIANQSEKTVIEMIREAMREKHIKQYQLAEMMGKSRGALSNQLNTGYMSAENWRKIAELLGYKVIMVPADKEAFLKTE